MPKLITRDGSQLTVQGDEVSVGRRDAGEVSAPDVDLSGLERGRTVSRRHARLFRERSAWHLRAEQGATNTTKVAGRALRPGEDGFGDYIQVFHCATSKGTMSASGDWGLVSTTGH